MGAVIEMGFIRRLYGLGDAVEGAGVVEAAARADGFESLQLDVRETQTAAISLYQALGFQHWGTNPFYAKVNGRIIAGCYFVKVLHPNEPPPGG